MLDQYYNFLVDRLVNWISNNKYIEKGNKYFLLLEDQLETENFYRALNNISYENKLVFESDEYGYKTSGIKVFNHRVIFVAPVMGVTQDFLVTVRNRVNENQGEWKDTSVIFIVNDALDSIIKGAYDLSQKNAPFNIYSIKDDIDKKIKNNNFISKQEKELLVQYLSDIAENSNNGIKDYEVVYSILSKGKLDKLDYVRLGYFYDSSLTTFNDKKEYVNRLKYNRESFENIENYHNMTTYVDDLKYKIEEIVEGKKIVNDLSKEDIWKKTDFKDVYKGIQKLKEVRGTKIEYSEENFSQLENSDYSWARLDGNTAKKRKKLFILLSSSFIDKNKVLSFKFTENINRSNLDNKNTFIINKDKKLESLQNYSVSGNTLTISLDNINLSETYGGKITYKHNNNNRFKFEILFMIVPFPLSEIDNLQANFRIKIMKSKKEFYFDISNDIIKYSFGPNPDEIISIMDIKDGQQVELFNKTIDVSTSDEIDYEGNLDLNLKTYYKEYFFPVSLSDIIEKPLPYTAMRLERSRLESTKQLVFEDERVRMGSKVISLTGS